MENSPENFLRIAIDNTDVREFELPSNLQGKQIIVTARKREGQFIDVSIQGGGFSFDHPVMQRMLKDLENPEKGDFATIAQRALVELHHAICTTVTP